MGEAAKGARMGKAGDGVRQEAALEGAQCGRNVGEIITDGAELAVEAAGIAAHPDAARSARLLRPEACLRRISVMMDVLECLWLAKEVGEVIPEVLEAAVKMLAGPSVMLSLIQFLGKADVLHLR